MKLCYNSRTKNAIDMKLEPNSQHNKRKLKTLKNTDISKCGKLGSNMQIFQNFICSFTIMPKFQAYSNLEWGERYFFHPCH